MWAVLNYVVIKVSPSMMEIYYLQQAVAFVRLNISLFFGASSLCRTSLRLQLDFSIIEQSGKDHN